MPKSSRLLSPQGQTAAYYALFGWVPGGNLGFEDVPGATTRRGQVEGEPVTLTSQYTIGHDLDQ